MITFDLFDKVSYKYSVKITLSFSNFFTLDGTFEDCGLLFYIYFYPVHPSR